ncbi:MAG: hypothetical protein ACFBSG_03150 [Leptolyngbyaceae cyanobacterium]
MNTQQLYLSPTNKASRVSGVAMLFFFLGAPNIYSYFRKQAASAESTTGHNHWMVGFGILAFVIVGTGACLNAMV